MALPEPAPGLVIHYAYLWREEARRGREEGSKARPCMIVAAYRDRADDMVVRVLPITHSPPDLASGRAIEVPAATGRRLGLDDERSWIIADEANRFIWPGYDLHPRPGRSGAEQFAYGFLPRGLFNRVRDRHVDWARERRAHVVSRDDTDR